MMNIWSLKRDRLGKGWVFAGKNEHQTLAPCHVVHEAVSELVFVPTTESVPKDPKCAQVLLSLKVSLSEIEDVVFKTEFGSI